MIKNTDGHISANLIFVKKVENVDHIEVAHELISTNSVAVIVNPEKQGYRIDIAPPIKKFLRKMNQVDSVNFTIVF